MRLTRGSTGRFRLLGLGALVVLVVAMALNTKFLTPAQVAGIGPQQFSATNTAADLFAKAQSTVPGQAKPLTEVLPALQNDVKGAAAKYQAVSPAEGSYIFAVTATGTVSDASTADDIRLTVPGLPAGSTVLVPTTTAINGTVVRDGMGFKFGDAPGQTEYQYVGDELKKLMQGKVTGPLGDPTALKGKKITVTGFLSVVLLGGLNKVPTAKPANIQPLKVDVS